jgi:leucyl/phenylalanyl-tRNA--protein transferase
MTLPLVPTIPVDALVEAYGQGRFPMCHEDGALYWHDPDPRAVFPLETIRPNVRMEHHMRSPRFRITVDKAFGQVIRACADRPDTWLDERLIASYVALHEAGFAHSVEVWERGTLVGGIYGVSLGGAYFAESMFNRVSNAGKIAFHALVQKLREAGYMLLDTQYINDFTASLGAQEVPRAEFLRSLARALLVRPDPIRA